MESSVSSDSEDEISELMKEAANCDYVNKLYSNKFIIHQKDASNLSPKVINEEVPTISSHQLFLAKSLSERIDKCIKLKQYDRSLDYHPVSKNKDFGIKLFSDSVIIDEVDEETEAIPISKPPCFNFLTEEEYFSRAREVAVSPEWVKSTENTSYWRFFRSKIINMDLVKKSGNKLECVVLSKNF